MQNKHITDLLPEYLDHTLDDTQKTKVETHIKECAACKKELEELTVLFNAFGEEQQVSPPVSLKKGFDEMLEREKENASKVVPLATQLPRATKTKGILLLKIAASIALLITAFTLGKYQQRQATSLTIAQLEDKNIEMKQTAMLSLMENKSASKRILGVNYIEEFLEPDETIVNALANRMLQDENTNVRMAAVEALGKFTASKTVTDAFITALNKEKDPGIQITIIQILVHIQEKRAAAPMQELLHQEDTQSFVKEQIVSLLPNII